MKQEPVWKDCIAAVIAVVAKYCSCSLHHGSAPDLRYDLALPSLLDNAHLDQARHEML